MRYWDGAAWSQWVADEGPERFDAQPVAELAAPTPESGNPVRRDSDKVRAPRGCVIAAVLASLSIFLLALASIAVLGSMDQPDRVVNQSFDFALVCFILASVAVIIAPVLGAVNLSSWEKRMANASPAARSEATKRLFGGWFLWIVLILVIVFVFLPLWQDLLAT